MVDPAQFVGVGGALGALCRYGVGQRIDTERVPVSTFTVNVVGSFLLGLVAFSGADESVLLFTGVGFCGAFTTFSSFAVGTVQLWENGHTRLAAAYALGTVVASTLAVAAAWAVLRVLLG
jgi:CrcB protein